MSISTAITDLLDAKADLKNAEMADGDFYVLESYRETVEECEETLEKEVDMVIDKRFSTIWAKIQELMK